MGGKKKTGQFVFLFGDARIRIRIRDVQTMPGLEGRGEAAGGGGREMGDRERISLLVVILFFCVGLRIDDVGIFLRRIMMMMIN